MAIHLETELSLFRKNLVKQGKPENTINDYLVEIRTLALKGDYENSQELAKDMAERANAIGGWSRFSNQTQAKYVSVARMFLKDQQARGEITDIPLINPFKRNKEARPTISDDQFEAITGKIPDTYVGQRDNTIFHLMRYAGLRTTEALSLGLDNLKYVQGNLQIILRNESQPIVLDEATTEVVKNYLITRREKFQDKSKKLFLGRAAEDKPVRCIVIRQPRRRFDKYAKAAEIKGAELHHLRTSYIISLVDARKSERDISRLVRITPITARNIIKERLREKAK